MTRRSRVIAAAGVLAAVFAATTLLGTSRGDDAGPYGTLALRRFLAASGTSVMDREEPGEPPETFVLLTDLRDEDQAEEIVEWVRRGGRLVLADPQSQILPLLRMDVRGGNASSDPGCAARETLGVRTLAHPPSATGLGSDEPAVHRCFGDDGAGLLAARDFGAGRVIALAGIDVFTNRFLSRDDNAVLASRVFEGGGPIVFGGPLPPGAERTQRGLWATLPFAAKVAIAQLVVAVVLLALARGRRLGRYVLEDPLVPVPANMLVRATGALYRSARAGGFAARISRRATAARLATRLSTPPDPAAVAAAAGAGGEVLVGPEPDGDAALLDEMRKLERLRRDVEGADR